MHNLQSGADGKGVAMETLDAGGADAPPRSMAQIRTTRRRFLLMAGGALGAVALAFGGMTVATTSRPEADFVQATYAALFPWNVVGALLLRRRVDDVGAGAGGRARRAGASVCRRRQCKPRWPTTAAGAGDSSTQKSP